ncbi:MAG: L-carnitine dehydratase/bile acid-inducible protein F [Candidatus Ozemobacter sibiricus]|uniref:L-carnitine dehydratase/bile acid-inducible protein F n=1 Tax=Candidatus Ozemobacter sibiricus TaxID=2268124 RepID=A0A367ZQR4_9BACT|nr:MAG: L-carnitine dehydratase/bile acid-inducible protein F [Candidatus Ozemobacter sibiricus]
MPGPLNGIVVVDLTRVLAGPFCTMLLADLGAEVIKIERPDGGDDSRAFGPFVQGESAYFMSINRGKKSATLNLKHPQGKELLQALVAKADILVENFKPGVMDRLGLGYAALSALNPRLIYAASSGFGQTGPYSDRPAYDLIIQGMGGLMSITGPDARHPTKVGSSIADIFAGVFTTIGILAALHARAKTGRGQLVDVGMLDCMAAILENAVARYVATGTDPQPIGNRHPSIAPFATFTTADGAINLAIGNDELWKKFCGLVGAPALADDPRYATNPLRVQHWADLEIDLNKILAGRTTAAWLELFQAKGIPSGPINSISQVLADAHILARQMLVEVSHPTAGPMKIPGVPIKLSATPAEVLGPAPLLGQHNAEIWGARLGRSPEAIATLKSQGVI